MIQRILTQKVNTEREHVEFESLDEFVGKDEEEMELFDDGMETEEWDEEDAFGETEPDFQLEFDFGENAEDVMHASTSEEVESLKAFDVTNGTHEIDGDSDFDAAGELGNFIVASATNGSTAPTVIDHVGGDKELAGYSDREIDMIEQLKLALPGLPMRRIVKIMRVFKTNLAAPSMLSLIPILRETMPDYLHVKWLKKVNRQNAEFVLEKAIENGTVNRPILDTMLQVKASTGALDGTIEFYEEQYRKQNMVSRLLV
jgi:hypothetical protein